MSDSKCIAVLGAGPAGLSAALWLRNLGFEPHVMETSARAGGLQNLNFLANGWVLGQTGQTGPMLAARFVDHAVAAGVPVLTAIRPISLTGRAGDFCLFLDNGVAFACRAIVIATGTRYRAEEVFAGVDGFGGVTPERIAYGPYAFANLEAHSGKRVLIVGGGDNAFENARLLAPRAAMVHLAVRSRPHAQGALFAAVAAEAAAGRCRLLESARLLALRASPAGIEVALAAAGTTERIAVDRIHVLAGYEPNTAFIGETFVGELRAAMHFDDHGYLVVDAGGRTGAAGIYAAGDVCNPSFPCVVSAIAQGAQVAKTIELDARMP